MTFPEIGFCALIAVTFLYWMVIVERGRRRDEEKRQRRSDTLRGAADPARGGGPTVHEADDGHDGSS